MRSACWISCDKQWRLRSCLDWPGSGMATSAHTAESKLTLLTTWQTRESKRWGVEARNTTLFRKLANWKDGRLESQSNHLVRVWMPGSFMKSGTENQWGTEVKRQNRGGEVVGTKVKGRERQWGSKVKGPSVFQNISGNGQPLEGCVNLFFLL